MRIMRKTILPCLFWLALFAGTGAGGEQRTLNVYTWEEYFSPRAIELFEEEFGCSVEFTYYDDAEAMVEHLNQGGGYDVITPGGVDAVELKRRGLLLPLSRALLPNLRNLAVDESPHSPDFHDRNMRYSVPYTVTVSGVAYNRDMVPPELAGSWRLFGDPRLKGKLAMLNNMREPIGAALISLGRSANSSSAEDLDKAAEQLLAWKGNIAMFSLDEARENLIRGKLAAIQTYNGEYARTVRDNGRIAFFVPEEGSISSSDLFVIGADTKNTELSHSFINFFLRPDIAAMNMEDIFYTMPNRPGLEILRERTNNPDAFQFTPEVMERCEALRPVGDAMPLYDKTWEKVLFDN